MRSDCLVPFPRYSALFVETRKFFITTYIKYRIWRPRWDALLESHQDLYSFYQKSCAIVPRCLRYPAFNRFHKTPTCDGRTDRQPDEQTQEHIALIASRRKNADQMVLLGHNNSLKLGTH